MSKLSDYKKGVYIYALRRPGDRQIVYVGLTDEPARRLLEHVYQSGWNVEMLVLEKYKSYRVACNAERKWIVYFARLNPDLWNGADLKRDYCSPDIDVNFCEVKCITVAMAEAVFDYHNIVLSGHMFDGVSGFKIYGKFYEFNPRPYVKKIVKSWDISWHDVPCAIESHCRLAFDAMGLDGGWQSCLSRVMTVTNFSSNDVFNAAILLAHYGYYGLPKRGSYFQDVSRVRKLLSKSLDQMYADWAGLSSVIDSRMSSRLRDLNDGFKSIEVYEGSLGAYKSSTSTQPRPSRRRKKAKHENKHPSNTCCCANAQRS